MNTNKKQGQFENSVNSKLHNEEQNFDSDLSNKVNAIKEINNIGENPFFYVEDYRNPFTDESIWLQELINLAGENATLVFEMNHEYELNNGLKPKKNQLLVGNGASIKRANQSTAILTTELSYESSTLEVELVPSDWKIGDEIHVYIGISVAETSYKKTISNITETSITLSTAIEGFANTPLTPVIYPIGASVRKIFNLIEGEQYPDAAPYKIRNFIIDGNALNNSGNFYWSLNTSIYNFGFGGEISSCYFKNIPNENIVCSGISVVNNTSEDLNGSFIHLSSPPENLGANLQGTLITNNKAFRTNKIDPSITGHSYAVVENSWNPGKTLIEGNYFEGINNDTYCNNFIFPDESPNGLTNEIIISNNIFKNYGKICQPLTPELLGSRNQRDRIITGNIFIDCGNNDFKLLPSEIRFHNNTYSGNTTVIKNIVVFDEIFNVEGLKVNNPLEPFSTEIRGLNQPNAILIGTPETKAGIQGYNLNTLSLNTDIHIQPYGGNVNIGGLLGSTDKLWVNGTAKFEGNVKTISATANNHAVTKGQMDAIINYKVYKANISQNNTSEPIIPNILTNNLSNNIVWSYSSLGTYIGTLANAFTNNKTDGRIYNNKNISSDLTEFVVTRKDNNTIEIKNYRLGILNDSILLDATIEIIVYN